MKRIGITPRENWEEQIRKQGFLFFQEDGYYDETAVYEFAETEIAFIENATREVYEMCLKVVDYVVEHKMWREFKIPVQFGEWIAWSWKNQLPSFYGRFDFAYKEGEIKLFEFNADTPTLLLESSVIQWCWLEDYNKHLDQFNCIHELLLKHIAACKSQLLPGKLYFSASFNLEDFMTVKYLQDVATQAGIETEYIDIDDIGINRSGNFVDKDGNLISNIFKIYPYEWLFAEPFAKYLLKNRDSCYWIEPPYKAILSNKMMLKYIFQLFPNSPYILPAGVIKPFMGKKLPKDYVAKPIFSREGSNVHLIKNRKTIESTGGWYGKEGYIYQKYVELPDYDGKYPILGSWVIGGKPAGFGIRESKGRITNVTSNFCAHFIAPNKV